MSLIFIALPMDLLSSLRVGTNLKTTETGMIKASGTCNRFIADMNSFGFVDLIM